MPALFTRISTRPNRASVARMISSHAARDDTSAGWAIELGEAARHASTILASRSARRATATTRAPRRARSVATAAPIPDDAPVTTATRSVNAMTEGYRDVTAPRRGGKAGSLFRHYR